MNTEDIIYWAMYEAEYNELEIVAKAVYKIYKNQREANYPESDMSHRDWHRARQLLEKEKQQKANKLKNKKKKQAKRERALLNKWGV